MHIFPNNKKYIGIAHQDKIQKRWGSGGCGYFNNRQPAIERAIKKYGWDNVQHVILEKNLSREKSKIKETHYISQYNTYGSDGYNLTPGGDDNTRKSGADNPFARTVICNGRKYNTLKEFCQENNLKISTVSGWLNGYSRMPIKYYNMHLHYDDSDMSIITPQVGKASGARNKFSQQVIFDGVEYPTVKSFCEKFGISKDSLYKWVNGETSMPAYFYDKGLHYKGKDRSKIRRRNGKDKYVYTDLA